MGIFYKLQMLKSGSAANNLGGAISATQIAGQTGAVTLSGMTFVFAHDNQIGNGTLYFYKSGDTIDSGTEGADNPSLIDAVPGMTSNSTPAGLVSTSQATDGSSPYHAFDNLDTTAAYINSGTGWIEYQFDSPVKINKYSIRAANSFPYPAKSWVMEAFNGATWDALHTVTNAPIWELSEKRYYTTTNNTLYTRYRILVTDVYGIGYGFKFAEIEFIENQAVITAATDCIVWKAPGDYKGAQIDVTSNGTYEAESNDTKGAITVTVVSASLPGSATSESIALTQNSNEIYDDITYTEAFNGDIEYRCIYFKNTDSSSRTVKLWNGIIDTGGATIRLGLDPGGVNATAQVIQNEHVAPAGVNFSNPVDEASSLSFVLTLNQYHAIWFKREIAGGAKPEHSDTAQLVVMFY